MKNFILVLALALLVSASLLCKKESDKNVEPPGAVELKDSVIASNLNFPWEILWGPDNQIWMTERGGRISRLNPTTGVITPILTINEVESNGEGGLLGMALHPDFLTNGFLLTGHSARVVQYLYCSTCPYSE